MILDKKVPKALPFSLPRIPLDQIFKETQPIDIINFALVSKKCLQLVQNLAPFKVYSIHIRQSTEINVRIGTSEGRLEIRIVSARIFVANATHIKIGFWDVEVQQGESDKVDEDYREPMKTLLIKTKSDVSHFGRRFLSYYIFSLFKPKRVRLVNLNTRIEDVCFVIEQLNCRFEDLKVLNPFKLLAKKFGDDPESDDYNPLDELTSAHLQTVLDADVGCIHLPFDPQNAHYKGPFQRRRLLIDHGKWVTMENLINMKCETLIVSDSPFNAEQLNTLIQLWTIGEQVPNLQYCHFDNQIMMSDMEGLTENLSAIRWHPPLRDVFGNFRGDYSKCQIDYLRRDDGSLGFLMYFEWKVSFFTLENAMEFTF